MDNMDTTVVDQTPVTITVDIGLDNTASSDQLDQVKKITGVVSSVYDDASTITVEVSSQDVAKEIAGKIARLFPGKPVRWSSTSTSAQ